MFDPSPKHSLPALRLACAFLAFALAPTSRCAASDLNTAPLNHSHGSNLDSNESGALALSRSCAIDLESAREWLAAMDQTPLWNNSHWRGVDRDLLPDIIDHCLNANLMNPGRALTAYAKFAVLARSANNGALNFTDLEIKQLQLVIAKCVGPGQLDSDVLALLACIDGPRVSLAINVSYFSYPTK